MLTFNDQVFSSSHRELAKKVLQLAGYKTGDLVDVWSEITLSEKSNQGAIFNYRLDYVLRGQASNSRPAIVEIMMCSTSGGNKQKGTDIKEAFRRSILYASGFRDGPIKAPGVNVRQVWARMASQLIAKSQAALNWGGRTIWVVQDRLADYIGTQTALRLDELKSPDWTAGEVNMVSSDLRGTIELFAGPIRANDSSGPCWSDILGAAHIPELESIERKLQEKKPITTLAMP